MRPIIYLIIIAAAGYLGYNYYIQRSGGGGVASEEDTPGTPAVATAAANVRGPGTVTGNPAPVFKSKIIIPDGPPGQKHLAKQGTFYVLERTSTEHATGIAAVVPGEEVRLVTRKGNGIVKVTNGQYEFDLKESQMTNDLNVAQDAERKFALKNPPPRQP